MISFLYSTDWHAKGRNPTTRTDEYASTVDAKLRTFFRLGHELGVDGFLCGGDYFDSPYASSEYVTRIGKLIEHELKGLSLFGVWGNHDVSGWNPATVKRTSIGVFQEFAPYFKILSEEPYLFEANGLSVNLTGVSSYTQLDRDVLDDEGNVVANRSRDYVVKKEGDTPHIHIVHGYLSPKPILEDIPHTVISEMKHTEANVTLTGHEHAGFPVTRLDNGIVYNPGALLRVFASHEEMNRMPKFALVKIHADGTQEVEPIQCGVAKKGSEVMDRSELDARLTKEQLLADAREGIREVLKGMDIQGVDLKKILASFKDSTDPDVFQETKRRLGL